MCKHAMSSVEEEKLSAEVYYLVNGERHKVVNPHHIYRPHEGSRPKTNTANEKRTVTIRKALNVRLPELDMLTQYGFTMIHFETALQYNDYFDPEQVKKVYYHECESLVRRLLPESNCIKVLDCGVRMVHSP